MAQRNIFYPSSLPEFHNVHPLNPSSANPRIHIETTIRGSNEHTRMNYNAAFLHQNSANSGEISHNHHHPMPTVGCHQNMPHPAQNVPYSYNHHVNQTGTTMVLPPTENSRMALKRKTPAHPVYKNPHGYQFTGSSSNFPVPSDHFQLKPLPVFSRPLHPNGSIFRYQAESRISFGEEYQRNVKPRHNSAPQANLNTEWQSSSSRTPLFHSSSSMSAAAVVGGNRRPNFLPGAYSQWNHPTNAGCSNYQMNQSVPRNCVFTEQISAWNSDNSRNSYSVVANPQGHNAQGTWGGPARYDQRLVLNNTSSNYTNLAAVQGNGLSGTGTASSSRIPRPAIIQNSSTHRVPRNFNPGWTTFVPGNAQHGWTSHGYSMDNVPYSAFSLDLFDEHSDMRLDIDNMTYEELLVLEETIGNVNTGLSEDYLSRCLTEQIYCSSTSAQDDEEEASCPICLEEFEDKDSQGVLKCRHVYHVACIKKWLGLKKTCPVCKAPALGDDAKQKQKVSV